MSEVSGPVQQRARAMIARNTVRLTRLVDDLLEVSRITSGKIRLHRERITLRAAIEYAIDTVRPLIEQRGHTLTLRMPAEPVWVNADAVRLEQIVLNLLNNAAKYTDAKGRIELDVETESGQALLRVKDNGIGIERGVLSHIFEPFTQADPLRDPSTGGVGIGLALVRKLVEMHGGSMAVESSAGQGALFTVRLPLDSAPGERSPRDEA
jgi:signal transduction histidine kinase